MTVCTCIPPSRMRPGNRINYANLAISSTDDFRSVFVSNLNFLIQMTCFEHVKHNLIIEIPLQNDCYVVKMVQMLILFE